MTPSRPPRQLGLAAAIAAVTGEAIALGIFLTPAKMAKSLGSPLLLAAVWCGMAVVMACGALGYAELAVRFPEAGGAYVFLRQGYGERVAFLFGWTSAAVMDPGLAAVLAVGAAEYVKALVPLSSRAVALVPAAILLALAAVNILGTRLSGRVMAAANLLKIAVLLALVVWALAGGRGSLANLLPLAARRPGSPPLLPALAGAIVFALFSFGGWWDAAKLAGEIRDPARNLPRALTAGVLLVSAVYLAVSFAFLYVVPLERVVPSTDFVAQFGNALFGVWGKQILSAAVLLSVLGGLLALTLCAPRVYYAMARDGAFFSPFGRLHPRFGTPVYAILWQTGVALLLLALGAFDRIVAYFIVAAVAFIALSVSALFRLRPPVDRWWHPAATIVFIAGIGLVALLILLGDPLPALLGFAVVLAGDLLRRFAFPGATEHRRDPGSG
jgi:basic amino acid/polyamine antiporter, APA family